MSQGKKNVYTCQKCRDYIVTVDRDEGTTSFMLGCRSPRGDCGGMMQSSFYRVDPTLTPTWEWYKPEMEEIKKSTPAMADHAMRGGLFLRRIVSQ